MDTVHHDTDAASALHEDGGHKSESEMHDLHNMLASVENVSDITARVVTLKADMTSAEIDTLLPCEFAVGGHHFYVISGCVFMKQSCSARENRFYEQIRTYQESFVRAAMHSAEETVQRWALQNCGECAQSQSTEATALLLLSNEAIAARPEKEEMEEHHSVGRPASITAVTSSSQPPPEPLTHTSRHDVMAATMAHTEDAHAMYPTTSQHADVAASPGADRTDHDSRAHHANHHTNHDMHADTRTNTHSTAPASIVTSDGHDSNNEGGRKHHIDKDSTTNIMHTSHSISPAEQLKKAKRLVRKRQLTHRTHMLYKDVNSMTHAQRVQLAAILWWTIINSRDLWQPPLGSYALQRTSSTVSTVNTSTTRAATPHTDHSITESTTPQPPLAATEAARPHSTVAPLRLTAAASDTFTSPTLDPTRVGHPHPADHLFHNQRSVDGMSNNASFTAVSVGSIGNMSVSSVGAVRTTSEFNDTHKDHPCANRALHDAPSRRHTDAKPFAAEPPTPVPTSSTEVRTGEEPLRRSSAVTQSLLTPGAGQLDEASPPTVVHTLSPSALAHEQAKAEALRYIAPFVPRYYGLRRIETSALSHLTGPAIGKRGWYTSVQSQPSRSRSSSSKSRSAHAATEDRVMGERVDDEPDTHSASRISHDHNHHHPHHRSGDGVGDRDDDRAAYAPADHVDDAGKESKDIVTSALDGKSEMEEEDTRRVRAVLRKSGPNRDGHKKSSKAEMTREEPKEMSHVRQAVVGASLSAGKPAGHAGLSAPQAGDDTCQMLVMEDVCYGLKHPCVLDVKMGSRQYGLHPSPRKKLSKEQKALKSTSAKYGIRLAGYRRWNEALAKYESRTKLQCRHLTLNEIREELHLFMRQSRSMEHRFRHQLENLRIAFSKQTVFRFFTSSLLFVYDADAPLYTSRVVMVDFAYTYDVAELANNNDPDAAFAYDIGYIKALDTLLSLLA